MNGRGTLKWWGNSPTPSLTYAVDQELSCVYFKFHSCVSSFTLIRRWSRKSELSLYWSSREDHIFYSDGFELFRLPTLHLWTSFNTGNSTTTEGIVAGIQEKITSFTGGKKHPESVQIFLRLKYMWREGAKNFRYKNEKKSLLKVDVSE